MFEEHAIPVFVPSLCAVTVTASVVSMLMNAVPVPEFMPVVAHAVRMRRESVGSRVFMVAPLG
jgi:hypothetical protein